MDEAEASVVWRLASLSGALIQVTATAAARTRGRCLVAGMLDSDDASVTTEARPGLSQIPS